MVNQGKMKHYGVSGMTLRIIGFFLIVAGLIGKVVIENAILNFNTWDSKELVEVLKTSPELFNYVSIAMFLRAIEACAVPIFAFLVAEGFSHTSNVKLYLIRVGIVAFISEIPFNLVYSGHFLDFKTRNPVFGILFALIMLILFDQFTFSGFKNFIIKALIVLGAIMWAQALQIYHGAPTVLLAATFWLLRDRKTTKLMVSTLVSLLCCIFSPFYVMAALGALGVHLCNGERGDGDMRYYSLAYPGILLVTMFVASFI